MKFAVVALVRCCVEANAQVIRNLQEYVRLLWVVMSGNKRKEKLYED
jgi:hypothetical protein